MPWSPQQAFPAARGPLLQMALSAPGREQARAERLGISRREASLNVCRGQHIDQIIDVPARRTEHQEKNRLAPTRRACEGVPYKQARRSPWLRVGGCGHRWHL